MRRSMSKSEKKRKTGRMENYGMYEKEPSRGKGHVVQESVRHCISNRSSRGPPSPT